MRITNFLDKMILAEIHDCIWADRVCGTNSQGFEGKMLDTVRKNPRKILRLPKHGVWRDVGQENCTELSQV